jgi:hypothetical protein
MWLKGSGVAVGVKVGVRVGEGVGVGLGAGWSKGVSTAGLVKRTNPVRLSERIKKTRLFK